MEYGILHGMDKCPPETHVLSTWSLRQWYWEVVGQLGCESYGKSLGNGSVH